MLAQGGQVGVGKQLPVAQVAACAQVIVRHLNVLTHRAQNLERLRGHLGANAVATNHCKFHLWDSFLTYWIHASTTLPSCEAETP